VGDANYETRDVELAVSGPTRIPGCEPSLAASGKIRNRVAIKNTVPKQPQRGQRPQNLNRRGPDPEAKIGDKSICGRSRLHELEERRGRPGSRNGRRDAPQVLG